MNPNATAVVEGRVIQEGPVEEQTCGELRCLLNNNLAQ
jgi:hypothetical protein